MFWWNCPLCALEGSAGNIFSRADKAYSNGKASFQQKTGYFSVLVLQCQGAGISGFWGGWQGCLILISLLPLLGSPVLGLLMACNFKCLIEGFSLKTSCDYASINIWLVIKIKWECARMCEASQDFLSNRTRTAAEERAWMWRTLGLFSRVLWGSCFAKSWCHPAPEIVAVCKAH